MIATNPKSTINVDIQPPLPPTQSSFIRFSNSHVDTINTMINVKFQILFPLLQPLSAAASGVKKYQTKTSSAEEAAESNGRISHCSSQKRKINEINEKTQQEEI